MATSTHDKDNIKHTKNEFVLGIDIGTTTVKTTLLNYVDKETIAQKSIEHNAYICVTNNGEINCQKREQNVGKILLSLNKCVKLLPEETVRNVKEIVLCGQMHGCVLWGKEKASEIQGVHMEKKLEQIGSFVSSLITWEDGRCTSEFLSSLPKGSLVSPLASGFGCASLFWLQRYAPETLQNYDRAGTIMDLVVACLCSNNVAYMSSQNAYSWGYFDGENGKWQLELLTPECFPTHLLPVVCDPGHTAGQLSQCWYGIPSGVTVRMALGDMQCSIFATLAEPGDAVLNIGTSTQLSVIVKEKMEDVILQGVLANPALNIVPYFKDFCLVVAPSLTGGNVLAFFVKTLQNWTSDLGLTAPTSEVVYEKLSECELQQDTNLLNINPVLWGERHNPKQTASVTDITQSSLTLGNVYRSLCHGLIVNVESMMNNSFLGMCKIQKIRGTGNALVRNPTLQESVKNLFNFPFVLCKNADASVGAALSTIK